MSGAVRSAADQRHRHWRNIRSGCHRPDPDFRHDASGQLRTWRILYAGGLCSHQRGYRVRARVFRGIAGCGCADSVGRIGFEQIFLRPLRNADILATALVTIGLSIFLQNTALLLWGPRPGQVDDPFAGAIIAVAGVGVTTIRLFALTVAVIAMSSLGLVIKYTKLGRMMRATFQDRDAAALQGIEVDHVFSLSFIIGVALASLAGGLLSAVFVVSPDMGNMANLKSFAVVILGGLGNVPGAVAGGFLLGLAESFGAGYVSAGYKDSISFLLLIMVLLIRPYGLFGREGSDA